MSAGHDRAQHDHDVASWDRRYIVKIRAADGTLKEFVVEVDNEQLVRQWCEGEKQLSVVEAIVLSPLITLKTLGSFFKKG